MIAHTLQGSSNKPSILFMHGFLANRFEWFPLMDAMKDRYHCIAIDLPGHGDTPIHEKNTTFSEASGEIFDLLDHLGVSQCHLIAYSMGGRFALQLIHQRPHLFLSCVLESSCPGLKTEKEREDRIRSDEYIAGQIVREAKDFRKYLRKWYTQPFFKTLQKSEDLFEKMLKIRLQNDPVSVAQSLRYYGTGRQPSLWKTLSSVVSPVLLICGLYDKKFVRIAREMTSLLPVVHMVIVSDCGHNIHLEKFDDYRQMIEAFFRDYPPE